MGPEINDGSSRKPGPVSPFLTQSSCRMHQEEGEEVKASQVKEGRGHLKINVTPGTFSVLPPTDPPVPGQIPAPGHPQHLFYFPFLGRVMCPTPPPALLVT